VRSGQPHGGERCPAPRAAPALARGRGRRRDGVGFDISRGLTVLDGEALGARLGEAFGIDLAPHRDGPRFRAATEADLRHWVGHRRFFAARRGYPADDGEVVAGCLAALGHAA
jgi:hypothetical protein